MRVHRVFKQPEYGIDLAATQAANDSQGVRHLLRYYLAKGLVAHDPTCRVWDLGCGAGYGADIFRGHSYLGVDGDSTAYALCKARPWHPQTTFIRTDLSKLWDANALVTQPRLILALDILDQLAAPELFLAQLVDRAGSIADVVISSPAFGAERWTYDLYIKLLSRFFKNVKPIFELSAWSDHAGNTLLLEKYAAAIAGGIGPRGDAFWVSGICRFGEGGPC